MLNNSSPFIFPYALCPNFSLSFTPVLNENRQALTLIFSLLSRINFVLRTFRKAAAKASGSKHCYFFIFGLFLHIAHFTACGKHVEVYSKMTFEMK